MYSGQTAAKSYSLLHPTSTVLILGPNHTGMGSPFSLVAGGSWDTPLGRVPIDETLSKRLLEGPYLEDDDEAHVFEHAIEVQLPFLQYLRPDVRFVPFTIGTLDLERLEEVGRFVGQVLSESKERVLLIISSDMNHYEDDKTTQQKDQKAITALLQIDPAELAAVVSRDHISMCGFGPAYVGLVALNILNVTKSTLVDHTTSACTSGDYGRVVGYAGMIFE